MKTILVADDEYDIVLALELVLSAEGYNVVKASNGKEALDRIVESRPELAILDVMMPVLTGIETIEFMKKQPALNSIPVVLMSAAPIRQSQKALGYAAFVKKPFDVDKFLAVIEQLIGRP